MPKQTRSAMIANLFPGLEDSDTLTIAFQGGEPTLAGLPWFQDFVREMKAQERKAKVSYALQTNGIHLNGEWCEFLREN